MCYHSGLRVGLGSMVIRTAPYSPKFLHHWNLTIRLFSVISRTFVGGGVSYPTEEVQLVHSIAPADWVIHSFNVKTVIFQIIQFSINTI